MDVSSNAVALAGIIATATVALAGLGVQALVAWLARRQERRRARYEELVVLYEETAATLSHLDEALDEMADDDYRRADEVLEVTSGLRHLALMLDLHRVNPAVAEAWNAIDACMRTLSDGGDLHVTRDQRDEFSRLVHAFYVAAGEHTRSVWPPAREQDG